ncbi:MAG TPA: ATP-dependent DNA ligase, partial [Jiangellaceae bacterium]|nr:ATP-dependent DNA ligase [Jiangellaceae bacterium]
MAAKSQVLEVVGREVTITNPDRLIFASIGATKLDLVNYYLAVADGALRGVEGRPMVLKRFVKGIDQEAVWQKRAPSSRPDWIEVAELH